MHLAATDWLPCSEGWWDKGGGKAREIMALPMGSNPHSKTRPPKHTLAGGKRIITHAPVENSLCVDFISYHLCVALCNAAHHWMPRHWHWGIACPMAMSCDFDAARHLHAVLVYYVLTWSRGKHKRAHSRLVLAPRASTTVGLACCCCAHILAF